jgi:hypothetical protein
MRIPLVNRQYWRKTYGSFADQNVSSDDGSGFEKCVSSPPAGPLILLAGTYQKIPLDTDITLTEPPSRSLPPRILRGYTTSYFLKEAYATLGLVAFTVVASYGCRWLATDRFTAILDDCQSTTATNSERLFLPNLRIFLDLSFTRAKVIDLT